MHRTNFYLRFLSFAFGATILVYSSQKAGVLSQLDQVPRRGIAAVDDAPPNSVKPNTAKPDSPEGEDQEEDPPPRSKKKKTKPVIVKAPETKPALCEIGYLDMFSNDMQKGVCLGDYLSNPDDRCWTFKPANLVIGGLSVIGYGTVGGPAGWILGGAMALGSGLDTADNYGDKRGDSDANAAHNATKFIKGGWRCSDSLYKFIMINADVKVEDQNQFTDPDSVLTKEKLCEPFYSINRKVFNFLNLPNKERDGLLCGGDKRLRDYYWRLTEEYREFMMERLSSMTALRCYDNGDGFAFTIQNNTKNKKTHYHVELTPEGRYKGFYAWYKYPKDDPQYENWKFWIDHGGQVSSYDVSADEKALAPGRTHFRFTDGPDGTVKLSSVGYLEHAGTLRTGYRVRYATGEQFLSKVPLAAPLRPFLVDVGKMREDYSFFALWADKAKGCCQETDVDKKAACLNQWPKASSGW